MNKKITLAFLLIIISIISFCQTETILREADEKTIPIKAHTNKETSEILDVLKKCSGPSEIKFNIKEHHEIYKTAGNLSIKLAVGNMVMQGNYSYKDFAIDQLLVPTTITYTYNFTNNEGKSIKAESFANESYKSGEYIVKLKQPSFDGEKESKIFLTNLELGYTSNDLGKLKAFIETVDAYYNADALLRMVNRELDAMYMDSIELLQENLKTTEINIEKFDAMKQERFFSKLDLDANDPIGFKSHLGKTYVKNRSQKQTLEHKLKYMHETYYLKGMEWLQWGDTIKAQVHFYRSIEEKPNYTPPFYQIAEYDYSLKKYSAVLDTCVTIITKLTPDNDTRYSTVKLTEAVIYHYIDSINKYITNEQFAEGIKLLNKSISYATQIKGVRKFSEFDDIYGRINLAYYNQLVNETKNKLARFNLFEAKFNIDSLARFRYAFRADIQDETPEHNLQNELYSQWIAKGKDALENKMPDTAFISFKNAKATCKTYNAVQCTNELDSLQLTSIKQYYSKLINDAEILITENFGDSAVNTLLFADKLIAAWNIEKSPLADSLLTAAYQVKYNNLIAEGDNSLNTGDSRQALAFYNEALKLSQNISLQQNMELTKKISKAAEAIVIQYCDHGLTHADALQVDKAREYLIKAESVANQYSIEEVESVKLKIEQLRAALNSGECNSALYKFNIKFRTGEKFIEQKDFPKAFTALNEAIDICKSYKECELPLDKTKELKEKIRPVKIYQEEIKSIERDIEDKSYSKAIEAYTELSEYFTDSVKYNYNISHDSLFIYIKSHKDLQFIDFAVLHYSGLDETNKCIELLNILYKKEYNNNWAKQSMTALGKQLAQIDFEEKSSANPETLIAQYTKNDKWFRHLSNAYMEQWKEYSKTIVPEVNEIPKEE